MSERMPDRNMSERYIRRICQTCQKDVSDMSESMLEDASERMSERCQTKCQKDVSDRSHHDHGTAEGPFTAKI